MDKKDTANLDSAFKELEGVLEETETPAKLEIADNVDKLSFANQAKRKECLENDALEQDIAAKGELTTKVFSLIKYWFVFVGFLLTCNNWFSINISDSVMIALLTTTTINVIGLAAIVVRGYFPKK